MASHDIRERSTQPDPRLLEAVRLLRAGRTEPALSLLSAVAARASAVGPAHALQLEALIARGKRAEAASALDAACTLPLTDAEAADALAFFARQLDRHELSRRFYQRSVELAPRNPTYWYNLATSERALGHLDLARDACARSLALDGNLRPALLLRSEISRATASANHVDELRQRLRVAGAGGEAMFLHYALGKELHELGEYDDAFAAFAQGAAARRRNLDYDVAHDETKLRRIAESYPEADAAPPAAPVGRHIFIIGLPRSGTTLTERILGGLDHVRSNNETDNFSTALLRASPATGGDVFARAARADSGLVAKEYEALANPDAFTGSIIEKLPFNYLYVGAILKAFPTAPIIWVRRNPIDSCFAMFRTLFAAAYPFSYDLDELARYYAAYERLRLHWVSLYGDRLTFIDYEDLVAGPDRIAPSLASRCGLAWSPRALDIASNRSASLTASAAQVRHGIYSTSSGIWRRYRQHLAPLVARLDELGIAHG
ncbi:sulfotransferase family protein [Sphingomonas sp. CL5.1]|uniref:tetratricopeptide repeat-containing sulfotransferase family protein n=1 Tax=Sphingomonas sp. CL5.1 TaxID=2653203 RepID=UPI0015816C9B|nr:sulfotransferase [Sphingomonas sp. CL5.1]QKR99866.1 sulfotransferase family protein [Sphingomonas sp. CL5.1]